MRVGVLGPLEVRTDEGQLVRVPERKVRALLADLALHLGSAVSADRLVDDLWGDRAPTNPTGSLQTKVSQLRRALAAAEPGGRDLIEHTPGGYRLALPANRLDANEAERLAGLARLDADERERADLLADARALWRGPVLADLVDEDFTRPAVARLEELQATIIEAHAEARLALGEHRALVAELASLVNEYPTRERLRAVQMRALYRCGRHRDALRSFDDLRAQLRDELGLDPTPELAALRVSILNHDPSLRGAADLPVSDAQPCWNLPSPASELIGRADAVDQVCERLLAAPLVTLVGPGGVGKTRLAIEAAAGMLDQCPDGVCFVDLSVLVPTGVTSSTADAGRIAELVADAVGIRLSADSPAGVDPAVPLRAALDGRRLLLVIDNCEHVIELTAAIATQLIGTTGVRILATSREPLHIAGEHLVEVLPLAVPDHGDDDRRAVDLDAMRRSTAVQLFELRAGQAAPGFHLDASNALAVAEICRRLDGHPLAIELAAARVRGLGVAAIAERLDARFTLLAVRQRGVPQRHHTLEAIVDWSWQLLTDDERAVLRRLAVCAPGFDLEAAEAITAAPPLTVADIAGLVAGLVDRSLITRTADTDQVRYRLWETVGAYVLERCIEAGEDEAARLAHLRFYAARAELAEPRVRGHDQQQWLQRLDADTPNLRRALDNAAHLSDVETALRIVAALAWYWFLRGRVAEAHRSLTAALARVDRRRNSHLHARAAGWLAGFDLLAGLAGITQGAEATDEAFNGIDDEEGHAMACWFLGYVTFGVGDQVVGEHLTDEALRTFQRLDHRWGTAAGLLTAGRHALLRGDLGTVRSSADTAAADFQRLGDRWGQLQCAQLLGSLAEIKGDYDRAHQLHQDAFDAADELEVSSAMTYALTQLGRLAFVDGDHDAAVELYLRARRLAIGRSHAPLARVADLGLALCHRQVGQLDEAEAILRRLLDVNRRLASAGGIAVVAVQLGGVAGQRGDHDEAVAFHGEALRAARTTTDPRAIASALGGLAGAHAGRGDDALAARLLGAAQAARQASGAALPETERADIERITHALQERLGEDAFDENFIEGRTHHAAYPDSDDHAASPSFE